MLALHKIEGLTGASSSEIHGFGRDRTKHVQDQEPEISLDFAPHIRLEIACHSELVEQVITTIEKAAHTGRRGDGKILIYNIEQAVSVLTGERGKGVI
jgi:nitrogen regulatory protein PII